MTLRSVRREGKREERKEGRGRGERERRRGEREESGRNERVREGRGEGKKRERSHCKDIPVSPISLSYPTCSLQRIPQFPQGGRTMQVFCKCDEFMAALVEVCVGLIPLFSCGEPGNEARFVYEHT